MRFYEVLREKQQNRAIYEILFSTFEVDMLRDKLGINNQMKALLECLKNRQRGYHIKILNFSSFFPIITQSIQSVKPP